MGTTMDTLTAMPKLTGMGMTTDTTTGMDTDMTTRL